MIIKFGDYMLENLFYYSSFLFLVLGGYIILFNAYTLLHAYKQWGTKRISAAPILGSLLFIIGLLFYTNFSAKFYIYFIPLFLDYTVLCIPVAIYQHKINVNIYKKNTTLYLLDKNIIKFMCEKNNTNIVNILKQFISLESYHENIQKYFYCSTAIIDNNQNIMRYLKN